MTSWRLIESGHADGATNMAVDEAIAAAVARREQPPTLRLYGWAPPALSLGYFQPLDGGIDLAAIRARGYDIVRRPTGGRAILHVHELTYSVSVPQDAIRGGNSVM
ncbi:MAG: biotin/lipoate A/B protein ligase family protein, partial [Armatimonadota bacterium]